MSDIVELLIERRKFRYAGNCKCGKCCLVPHEMLCSAIDEIKRLQAALGQIASLKIDASFLADHVIWAKGLAKETLSPTDGAPEAPPKVRTP